MRAGGRLMSGKDIQEEAVQAAAKSLKAVESAGFANNQRPESAGLQQLFAAHHDRIFRTAYRVTGNASDAEDVLQTVFLRVARGQESAESAENAEAYFSRAAINASLDLLRSRKRSRAVAMDDVVNAAS